MEQTQAKQFELRVLHDELKGKLANIQASSKNHELFVKHKYDECNRQQTEKTQKLLSTLNGNAEKLTRLYQHNNKTDAVPPFFYKQQIEDMLLEEESFTSALTLYTRKQFFEGIAELAGSQDHSKYDLLDTNKPETLLIKGDSEEIKAKDREELKRLQTQYRISEETSLKNEMSVGSLRKAVETAEKQLQLLDNDRFHMTTESYKSSQKKLSNSISQKKEGILHYYESEVLPLLDDLQSLHGTKVLRGNYDLKIARQDYFLSKQSEVINQLLLQCSRNYFLSMMYEIELKEHRKSYHLLASSKSLLQKEINSIEKRIVLLSDPLLQAKNINKETISSRDHFVNKLYDALVPSDGSSKELYRTYESVTDQSKMIASQVDFCTNKYKEMTQERIKHLETLETTITSTQGMVTKQQQGMNSQLTKMIENLEEHLAMAEVQVNDIIKDVMTKKKIITTDSLKELERSIFPNFFNDPDRLKRTIGEIQARVKSSTQDTMS